MPTIQKSWDYQIFRNDVFLGRLVPSNPFSFALEVNNAGCMISMNVPLNIDTVVQEVEPLMDEAGNVITDENDVPIYIEKQPDVVGDVNENIMIQEGNIVKVYEFSDYYPNGLLRFVGKLQTWEGEFGNDASDEVVVIAKNLAQDLDNYLIQV